MKRFLLTVAALVVALGAFAQPQLRKDNIEEIIKAMTLQEKATLLVGGARAAMVNGASASPAPSSPTALPACASSPPARVTATPITAPASRWEPCWPAPGISPSWRM